MKISPATPPAFGDVFRRRRGDVVVGNDRTHNETLAGRHLHRQLDVHVVAGVVAVEAGDARAAFGDAEGIEEAFGRGGGEDFANRHGVHEARTDVAEESGFVARTTAGDDTDPTVLREVGVVDHALVVFGLGKFRMGDEYALEHVFDQQIRIVNDAIHDFPFKYFLLDGVAAIDDHIFTSDHRCCVAE